MNPFVYVYGIRIILMRNESDIESQPQYQRQHEVIEFEYSTDISEDHKLFRWNSEAEYKVRVDCPR